MMSSPSFRAPVARAPSTLGASYARAAAPAAGEAAALGHGSPESCALYQACAEGNVEEVQKLLESGATLDYSQDGNTALHALLQRTVPAEAMAEANVAAEDILTALHTFQPDAFKSLLSRKNRQGKSTPLHIACDRGMTAVVELLVDRGAPLDQPDGDGRLPLHVAAERGRADAALVLLGRGADVNALNGVSRWTPLHYAASFAAAQGGSAGKVVQLLLHKGATQQSDKDGRLPLDVAAERQAWEVVCDLLNHEDPSLAEGHVDPITSERLSNTSKQMAKKMSAAPDHGAPVLNKMMLRILARPREQPSQDRHMRAAARRSDAGWTRPIAPSVDDSAAGAAADAAYPLPLDSAESACLRVEQTELARSRDEWRVKYERQVEACEALRSAQIGSEQLHREKEQLQKELDGLKAELAAAYKALSESAALDEDESPPQGCESLRGDYLPHELTSRASAIRDEVERLRRQLEARAAEVERLSRELETRAADAGAAAREAELQKQLRDAEGRVGMLQGCSTSLQVQLDTVKNERDELQRDLDSARAELLAARRQLAAAVADLEAVRRQLADLHTQHRLAKAGEEDAKQQLVAEREQRAVAEARAAELQQQLEAAAAQHADRLSRATRDAEQRAAGLLPLLLPQAFYECMDALLCNKELLKASGPVIARSTLVYSTAQRGVTPVRDAVKRLQRAAPEFLREYLSACLEAMPMEDDVIVERRAVCAGRDDNQVDELEDGDAEDVTCTLPADLAVAFTLLPHPHLLAGALPADFTALRADSLGPADALRVLMQALLGVWHMHTHSAHHNGIAPDAILLQFDTGMVVLSHLASAGWLIAKKPDFVENALHTDVRAVAGAVGMAAGVRIPAAEGAEGAAAGEALPPARTLAGLLGLLHGKVRNLAVLEDTIVLAGALLWQLPAPVEGAPLDIPAALEGRKPVDALLRFEFSTLLSKMTLARGGCDANEVLRRVLQVAWV